MVADSVGVLASCAVVAGLSRSAEVADPLAQPVTNQVLAVVAAVVATGAAVQGALVVRLDGDTRARWVAAALVVFAFVVVPLTVFVMTPADPPTQRGARLVAYAVTVGLLLASVRPPPRLGPIATWGTAAAGAAVALGVLWSPPIAQVVTTGPYGMAVVAVGGAAAAAALLVDGYRQFSRPWWRVALGVMVVVLAQLYALGAPLTDQDTALTVGALRLVGMLTVVAGFAQLSVRALAELHSEQSAQREELLIAVVHMERASELAAERDHELRNGLAGLAGITHLLSMDGAGIEHERLRNAVLAELGRLNAILDSGGSVDDGEVPESVEVEYRLEPLLAGLAIMRQSAGAAVKTDIDPELRAVGDPAVLAQVVTNLLINCDRHAPGARVVLSARAQASWAVVEVRDEGPGLAPDVEQVVLERGVQDSEAGGSGLGLYISRRLVEREHGTLEVRTVHDPPGCLATVMVPRPGTR